MSVMNMRKRFRQISKRRFRFWWADFFGGYGSAIDLGGTYSLRLRDLYGNARTIYEVDARALASDWRAVGQDIKTGVERFEQKVVTQ